MFRAASRIPRRAVLAATTAGVVLSEAPEKLSIYSAPEPKITLVESSDPLSLQIGVYRRHLQSTYADSHAYVQGWVNKWISVEQAVENRIKSIISPQENLTPGLLYVGVSTLTGSILARNRFILTRLTLPPLFFILSARHFLPLTTSNLSNYLGSVEDKYFPTFAEKHEIAKAHTAMGWEMAKDKTKEVREKMNNSIVSGVERIQDATGLKIIETLGLGAEKAVKEGEGLVKKAEEKTIEFVHVAEQKVKDAAENVAHAIPAAVEPAKEPAAPAPEPPVVQKEEEPAKRLV